MPSVRRQLRRKLAPGLYWAPFDLHGLETLIAVAPDGETTLRTVEPGTTGADAVAQLEEWLRDRGVHNPLSRPALFLF